MKKFVLPLVAAAVLFSVGPARAFSPPPKWYPGDPDRKGDTDPTGVPEPSGFVQLAAGLFVLGGLALASRRGVASSQAE